MVRAKPRSREEGVRGGIVSSIESVLVRAEARRRGGFVARTTLPRIIAHEMTALTRDEDESAAGIISSLLLRASAPPREQNLRVVASSRDHQSLAA